MSIDAAELKAVSAVLKKRFNNLTVEETIDLATEVLDALTSVSETKLTDDIRSHPNYREAR